MHLYCIVSARHSCLQSHKSTTCERTGCLVSHQGGQDIKSSIEAARKLSLDESSPKDGSLYQKPHKSLPNNMSIMPIHNPPHSICRKTLI